MRAEFGLDAAGFQDTDAHVPPGDFLRPAIELMLTMSATHPGPSSAACSKCGRPARVVHSSPWTLTAIMRS